MFLKEINEIQINFENRRAKKQTHHLDEVVEQMIQILYELDQDLNFDFTEDEAEAVQEEQMKPTEQNGDN